MVGTFGLNFQITLALVVKEVFQRSAGAYGLLSAFLAVGSLIGALASARRAGPPRQRTLFASVLAFGLLEIAVGLAPTYELMAVLLVPTGVAVLTFTTTANSTVQLGSAPHVRGRVMALWIMGFGGTVPIGLLVGGAIAERTGVTPVVLFGAATALLLAALSDLAPRPRTARDTAPAPR